MARSTVVDGESAGRPRFGKEWQAMASEWQAVAKNGKTGVWAGKRPLRLGSKVGNQCAGALEARNRGREPHGFVTRDSSSLCNSFGR